jgi:K+/H+ antiporter YhaU regulatory subunit KhtT
MVLEFLGRLQKEFSITGQAIYETIIAIAERVNRKVEVLRLQGQAATVITQIDTAHADLGRQITAVWARRLLPGHEVALTAELNQLLSHTTARIHQLKQTLVAVDTQVRALKLETVQEDFLLLQRDLKRRSASLERVPLPQGSPAIGQKIGDLRLPESVRVVTIFRGPFFISAADDLVLRADDILIVVGLQSDLIQVAAQFTAPRHIKSA